MTAPTVTIAIPVLNEERFIDECLQAVAAQTYGKIVEILVVDGGSEDRTREMATRWQGVRVLDNPRRIQAAALNVAVAAARGDVIVRVDGHCRIAVDYVERAVAALLETGAAMVGGGMSPRASGAVQEAIAAAMASRLGAGPARFHGDAPPGWTDTVYLGAYRTAVAREAGGYSEDVGVNEDAEFAIRMAPRGGIWYDPSIRSEYTPRSSLRALARQFYRYGLSRAATVKKHPRAIAPRQLVSPLLLAALVSPVRRIVAPVYVGGVLYTAARQARSLRVRTIFALVLPMMHLSWGAGFYVGVVRSFLGLRPFDVHGSPQDAAAGAVERPKAT